MKHFEVAIVGAGIAGLAAARALDTQNYMIFEKSRGPGGRLASKRIDDLRVDIGAQFFTVRESRFQTIVGDAIDAGATNVYHLGNCSNITGMPVLPVAS